jgi:hypothetical protein
MSYLLRMLIILSGCDPRHGGRLARICYNEVPIYLPGYESSQSLDYACLPGRDWTDSLKQASMSQQITQWDLL